MKRFVCDCCGQITSEDDDQKEYQCFFCVEGRSKDRDKVDLHAAAINRLNATIKNLITAIKEK